jgi:hypothetical protein
MPLEFASVPDPRLEVVPEQLLNGGFCDRDPGYDD